MSYNKDLRERAVKYYKYVYKLWNLLDGANKVGIEEIAKPIEIPQDEYIIYQDYFKKVTVMLVNYMD